MSQMQLPPELLEFIQAQSGGTRTIINPATGETMEVLASDPRIQGLSDAEIFAQMGTSPQLPPPPQTLETPSAVQPFVAGSATLGDQPIGAVGTGINNSAQTGNVDDGMVYTGGTPDFDETTGTYTGGGVYDPNMDALVIGGQTGTGGGGIGSLDPGAFVSNVAQQNVSMDPTMQQLLFGLGGQPGFIQGAMQAAQNAFYNPDGTPIVYQQPVAGLSPGQLAAINLAQQNVGAIQPYLQAAQSAYAGSGAALQNALQQQVAAL